MPVFLLIKIKLYCSSLQVNLKLYGASEIVTLLSLIICKLYSSFFPEFRGNQNLADRINSKPVLAAVIILETIRIVMKAIRNKQVSQYLCIKNGIIS